MILSRIFFASCCVLVASCLGAVSTGTPAGPALLPWPSSIKPADGELRINQELSISSNDAGAESAQFFADELRAATGWAVPLKASGSGTIRVERTDWTASQGYALSVGSDGITLRAGTADNLFYAFQTLRQLCPAEVFDRDGQVAAAVWTLPAIEISDAPRFSHRGILVDVSRHFQTPEQMRRIFDVMALCKLNVLHWHLTDDQGWRPEVKAYPKLTTNAAKSYSQDELRALVAYAARRGITIIPEFDMPGHAAAIIRAYPELGTSDHKGKIGHTINPTEPKTYEFIEALMKEMSAIFPSPTFHIGADEVGTGAWRNNAACKELMRAENMETPAALVSYFVKHTQAILAKHGKMAAVWDEAFEGDKTHAGLKIWSWRGAEPGMKAAEAGFDTVMCPSSSLYYDRANSRSKANPKAYSLNTATLSQSYFFEPASPLLSADAKLHILGAQGCVWGEHIQSGEHLERQVMLRGAALSEALWSPRSSLDWDSFIARLAVQRSRLDALGVNYWWEPATTASRIARWQAQPGSQVLTLPLTAGQISRNGIHEVLLHYVNGDGTFNVRKVEILADGQSVASDEHESTATVDPRRPNQYYILNLKSFSNSIQYSIRITYEGLQDGCQAIALILPALPADGYSAAGSDPRANHDGKKQPDES